MPVSVSLAAKWAARSCNFDQRAHGPDASKPARILFHLGGFVLLCERCSHTEQRFQKPDGQWSWAAHPPLVGKDTSSGEWLTSPRAAYPPPLCGRIAQLIAVSYPLCAEVEREAAVAGKEAQKAAAEVVSATRAFAAGHASTTAAACDSTLSAGAAHR